MLRQPAPELVSWRGISEHPGYDPHYPEGIAPPARGPTLRFDFDCHCPLCTVLYHRPIRVEPETERERRAVQLLMEILEPEQRKTYRESGYVAIDGRNGHRYYVACYWFYGNVIICNTEGRALMAACAYPESIHRIPPADTWASQILTLRANPEAFVHVACHPHICGNMLDKRRLILPRVGSRYDP